MSVIGGVWQNIGSTYVGVELCSLHPRSGVTGHFPRLEKTGRHVAEAVILDNDWAYFSNNLRKFVTWAAVVFCSYDFIPYIGDWPQLTSTFWVSRKLIWFPIIDRCWRTTGFGVKKKMLVSCRKSIFFTRVKFYNQMLNQPMPLCSRVKEF